MNAAAKTNNRGLRVFTEVRKSPVLLLVIYNKNNATIEPDVIYEIFSKYGHVIKVLIFEKGTRTKAFIEFNTTEAASAAKIQMEGKLLFKDGTKASVFYATIDKIVFKNDSSAGKEYMTPDGTPMVLTHIPQTDSNGARLFKEPLEHRLEAREIIEEAMNENDDSYQELLEAELHNPKDEDMIPREFYSMKSQLSNPKDDDIGFKDFKSFRRINVTNSTNGDGNDIFFDEAISRQIEHLGLEERHEHFEKESDVSPQEKRDEMFINNFLEAAIREGQNQPFSATLNNSSSKKLYKEPPGLVPKHTLFSTNSSMTNIPPTFHSAMVLPSGSMPNPVLHSAGYLPAPPKTFNSSKSLGRDSYGEGRMEWGSLPSSFKTLNIDQFEEGKDFNGGGYEVNPSNVPNLDKFAHLLSDHKSPVIYVKGLDMYLTNVIMIYNIFSNFGNILKILFIKQKGIAFIEYESVVYSAIAKDSLNNCLFLGTPLKIFYSNYDSLQVRSKQGESFPDEELFIGSPMTTHRFKANKSISINPPSETLHVSNLQIQCCKDDIIRTLFSQYGTIDNLKFIFMENNRNMCLVKYATLEDSFWALANLHNYELGGRKIQISFTRSKI